MGLGISPGALKPIEEVFAKLKRLLRTVPEVVEAGTVSGSADAIVHLRAKDIPSLENALEKVRLAPNVDHTRSSIVLSRLIRRDGA